ncbi:TetR/AcrR family transcriptional regulator [Flavobacterium sp. DG1-102-2]|uniref:TetR/AcrR family transcriptional regulator n=1 Tax=Flavobacterium sp. DG1-102-2 TaxID=3081663 RepID=UPI00294A1B41|nr:TetR/AcrR family transcriptional regulator [Flavobacterium sp. DG1-102-2]MDV6169377.1 TetR/AcrR family transcriptional regulator [Flavobacterium sp. DG1-102-2]
MEEQAKKTQERNKEKSKQRFLAAVGKLLKTKGFSALKVNDIAAAAGLDKKLIYKYFGGKDQLIDEYLVSIDFWSNIKEGDAPPVITDGGQEFVKQMLLQQFDYVGTNEEFQKILLWGLSEKRKSLQNLADEREVAGELLLQNITDPFFGAKAVNFRASMAIIISGIYYLNMYSNSSNSTFCGIDPAKEDGKESLKTALSGLVDMIYKDSE